MHLKQASINIAKNAQETLHRVIFTASPSENRGFSKLARGDSETPSSAIIAHPEPISIRLLKLHIPRLLQTSNAQPERHRWLADKTVNDDQRRLVRITSKRHRPNVGNLLWRVIPADIDAPRASRKRPIGAVDVNLGVAAAGDGMAGREDHFKGAAPAIIGYGELDEGILSVCRAGVLGDDKAWQV